MKRYLLLLTFMAASFSAYSSTVHPAYEGFMQRVGGTSTTISFASDGKPILVGSRHLGTPHIGAMGLTTGINGVSLRSSGGLKVPGLNGTIPIIASTVLSRTLLGRALQIALPMFGLATTASLINEYQILFDALGIQVDSNGQIVQRLTNDMSNTYTAVDGQINFFRVRTRDRFGSSQLETCLIFARQDFSFPGATYTCHSNPEHNTNFLNRGTAYHWTMVRTHPDGQVSRAPVLIISTRLKCPDSVPIWYNNGIQCVNQTTPKSLTPQELQNKIQASNLSDNALLAAAKIASHPQIAPELLPEKQRLPVQLEFPGGHQSMTILEDEPHVITKTRVLPDGNIETKTQTIQRVARIQPHTQATPSPTVQFEEQTVTKRKVTTPTGQIVLPEETVSTETKPQPQEQPPNCGLPNTPPCRIYEPQSMPRPPLDDSARTLDIIRNDIEQCLSDIPECLSLPDISFTFSMPTACSPLALPGFERWMNPIDICSYRPYFHAVMNMVWAITGVFGAMAIIGRRF